MTHVWALAALWLGLALIATLFSIWLGVATALSEIVVGTIAQLIIGVALGGALLKAAFLNGPYARWMAGTLALTKKNAEAYRPR